MLDYCLLDTRKPFPMRPYDYVDSTTRLLLEAQARTYLYGSKSLNTNVSRNLVLASPHPGGVYQMENVVKGLAKTLDADVLLLDYLDISRLAQHMIAKVSKPVLRRRKRVANSEHAVSIFRPSDYVQALEVGAREEERDEDEEEDEHDDVEDRPSGEHWQSPSWAPGLGKKAATRHQHIYSLYHQPISHDQMSAFGQSLQEYLLARDRPTIVYIRDVNDFFHIDRQKPVIDYLVDAVSTARTVQPAMVICGASPSILEIRPDDLRDAALHSQEAVMMKDADFWRRMIAENDSDGDISHFLRQHYNMAQDGPYTGRGFIYHHSLSGYPQAFSTIAIAPPPTPSSLSKSGVDDDKVFMFRAWHTQLDKDHLRRIRELNWRTVVALCGDRNVVLDHATCQALISDPVPETLQKLAVAMQSRIWRMDVIEKFVDTVIGRRLNSPDNKPMILTMADFGNGFALIDRADAPKQQAIKKIEKDPTTLVETVGAVGTEVEKEPELDAQDSLELLIKTRNLKINSHEKKLLGCVVDPNMIQVSFKDLVLPAATKLALQTLTTLPLLRPELFSYGILKKSNFSGALLFGPPGTGKTMLAKCVAKTGGARFMNVSLSDVFEKYVGEGEKNVKAIFTLARKIAPCVVFVDEVDALFGRRRSDGHASRREVINEFMGQWDGLTSENGNIIVVAATNRPFDLDDAVLRRMPRKILVDLPDERARASILKVHLAEETLYNVDVALLAQKTPLYSGSDLKNLCVAAALLCVKENVVREAKYKLKPVQDPSKEDAVLRGKILKEMETVEDWGTFFEVDAHTDNLDSAEESRRVLTMEHFEMAMKEVPASLTDSTETLKELRKWDEQYGSKANSKSKKAWGFA
jgi:SpoVK/Ycf46/Vps4 family AAA+-type ATPase